VLPCLPEAQKTAVKQRLIPWVSFHTSKRALFLFKTPHKVMCRLAYCIC
jgi:hypothetical protein